MKTCQRNLSKANQRMRDATAETELWSDPVANRDSQEEGAMAEKPQVSKLRVGAEMGKEIL